MGIPVQKWQWPVNQIRPLGATCAACVKLHKDKTVLTFHQESVGKNFKRASYFVCFLHVEVGQVQGFCRKDIQYDKILNKASHPPSFQSSSSLFSESCVPQREEFQLSSHWLSVWSGIWWCVLSSLWRGNDWFCQSGDCLTSSLNHKIIDWEWWIHG